MSSPFLICGFPRSRTAWLAALLGAHHEPSLGWRGYDDAVAFYRAGGHACDSVQTLIAGRLLRDVPDLTVVVIDRDRVSVECSLRKLVGEEPTRDMLDAIEREMGALNGVPGCLRLPYNDINYIGCLWLWLRLFNCQMPRDHYDALAGVNIQADIDRHRDRVRLSNGRAKSLLAEFHAISSEQ